MSFRLDPTPPPPSPGPAEFGAGSAPRPDRAPHPGRRPVLVVLAGMVAVGGGVALQQLTATEPSAAAPPPTVAVPAAGPALLDTCIDRSFGMHRIGSAAITEIDRTLSTYAAGPDTVRRSAPVEPVPGLEVRVRLVRPDSYVVTDPLNAGVPVHVPAVPGVATAEPAPDAAPEVIDDYEASHRAATVAVAAADRAVEDALPDVRALADRPSEGSDVTGCVFALARDAGSTPVSALVVSDFGDTGLSHPDGSRREFVGDLSRVHLTVVPVCTGADPGRCEARYDAFLARTAGFGLDVERSVTRIGPGDIDAAGDDWLRTGLDLIDTTTAP